MQVAILALDGVFDTGLAVLMDTFATANELAAMHGIAPPLLDVKLVGVRRRIRTALGMTTTVEPATAVRQPDWGIVPALNTKQPDRLVGALGRKDVQQALTHLRAWHDRGIGLAAACIGTFLLGEAGLLDSRDATTTWALAPLFRQRYPDVRLDDSRMLVASRGVVTAAAMMGHLDLALWLVRQASPQMAGLVARVMLIDRRTSQAQYVIPDFLAHADPLIERFEQWARRNLAGGFSLEAAASALSVTARTLQRRTEAVLGKSPLAFFQDMRIERARHLIAVGDDIAKIAGEVGYADPATLRNLLRRRLGRGVRDLRTELQMRP
ncbi:MAG TPA: helix-turn-helix domain-containing protein [Acetobacteraceae bacterium]|nr:helix-turn-helix domain-containing protein [Acetobacteraceae bacterium]